MFLFEKNIYIFIYWGERALAYIKMIIKYHFIIYQVNM